MHGVEREPDQPAGGDGDHQQRADDQVALLAAVGEMPADQCERDEGDGLGEADEAERERIAGEQVQLVAEGDFLRQQRQGQQEAAADQPPEFGET